MLITELVIYNFIIIILLSFYKNVACFELLNINQVVLKISLMIFMKCKHFLVVIPMLI